MDEWPIGKYRIIFSITAHYFKSKKGLMGNGEIRVLNIRWGNKKQPYKPGDAYVMAIKSGTNLSQFKSRLYTYTEKLSDVASKWQLSSDLTLKEIVVYIDKNKNLLGPSQGGVSRCFGIILVDENGAEKHMIDFPFGPIINE